MNVVSEPRTDALGPEQNGVQMTPEQFDAVTNWDELYTYELVHGVLIVNPVPSPQERGPNEFLGHLLLKYQEEHPQGKSLDDTLVEHHVRTSDSRRRADRVIWAGLARQPDPNSDVPSIVVEFVSEGRRNWQRDYIEKRDEYLAVGVQQYWVIDRFVRRMTVFVKEDDGWKEQVVKENETYRPAPLPGFELPLACLLERADRWTQSS